MPAEVTIATPKEAAAPAPPIPSDWFGGMIDNWTLKLAVEHAVGKDTPTGELREAVHREVVTFAREVAGPDPNAVEWSLATTIALAQLAMRMRESTLFSVSAAGAPIRSIDHQWRMLNKATARYCALLRTLAAVRRAGSPAVQIFNAGGTNQTNIAMP